jgi:hypothetical protein
VVGDKGLERGVIEYKARSGGASAEVPLDSILSFVRERVSAGA